MKRNIIYLLLMILVLTIGACKEDEVSYYKLGSEFVVSTSNLTTLDNSAVLFIDASFNVSSVTVKHTGGVLADKTTKFTVANTDLGSITTDADGTGSLVVPEARLGMNGVGATASVMFTAIADDGTLIDRALTVTYKDPFTFTNPYKPLVQYDKSLGLKYKIKPGNAAITSITVQKKTNFNGVYADVADAIDNDYKATDSVMVNGKDYNGGVDTIYVKVTANTAVKTVTKVVKLPIGYYAYPKTVSFKLTPAIASLPKSSLYDLQKRRFIATADEVAMLDSVDIKFTSSEILPGNYILGFTAPKNAEFVKAAGLSTYTNGNIVGTEGFDFSASGKSFSNVLKDDVYIFRTKRGAGAWTYGLLRVISVTKAESGLNDSYITFELKYK